MKEKVQEFIIDLERRKVLLGAQNAFSLIGVNYDHKHAISCQPRLLVLSFLASELSWKY